MNSTIVKRFLILDSFRGLFAVIVAIYHYKSAGPVGNLLIVQNAPHLVDFFFVLSGFIIYHNYSNLTWGKSQREFIRKRLFRLYPLHFFMLITFLILESGKYVLFSYGVFKSPVFEKNNLQSFIVNVFFLQSANLSNLSWNYPSWSISAEMITYLVYCIIIARLRQANVGLRIFIFIIVSALAFVGIRILTRDYNLEVTHNFGFLRCVYGFFIGCLTYEWYNRCSKNGFLGTPTLNTLVETTTFAISIAATMFLPENFNSLLPIIYAITILCFSFENGLISVALSNRYLQKVGELSYSIYMIHAAVAIVFEIVVKIFKINSPAVLSLISIVYISVIIFMSKYTHKYVEIGFNKWLQKKTGKSSKTVYFESKLN